MTDPQLQQKRLAAAAIDIAILVALAVVAALVGVAVNCSGMLARSYRLSGYLYGGLALAYTAVAVLYVLGRDVIGGNRSLGKLIMGLRVIQTTGAPITALDSIKRNALFAPAFALNMLVTLMQLIPVLKCFACLLFPLQLAAGLLAIGVGIWELVQIVQQPDGVRMGDQMAGTRVVF